MTCSFTVCTKWYGWWVMSKMKKMKTERESAGDFLILSLFFVCLEYFMTNTITKRSKGFCAISLYIKYKSMNCLYNNETKEKIKGCVRYIFAILFFMFKRKHLWNKEECFSLHLESSFCSWDNQMLTFQIFKCPSMKHKTHFTEWLGK